MKNFIQRLLLLIVAMGAIGSSAFGMIKQPFPYADEFARLTTATDFDNAKMIQACKDWQPMLKWKEQAKVFKAIIEFADKVFKSKEMSQELKTALNTLLEAMYNRDKPLAVTSAIDFSSADHVELWTWGVVQACKQLSDWKTVNFQQSQLSAFIDFNSSDKPKVFSCVESILRGIEKGLQFKPFPKNVLQECIAALDAIYKHSGSGTILEKFDEKEKNIKAFAKDVAAKAREQKKLQDFPALMKRAMEPQEIYNYVMEDKEFVKATPENASEIIGWVHYSGLELKPEFYKLVIEKSKSNDSLVELLITWVKKPDNKLIKELIADSTALNEPDLVSAVCSQQRDFLAKKQNKPDNFESFINIATAGIKASLTNLQRTSYLRSRVIDLWTELFKREQGIAEAQAIVNKLDGKNDANWDGFVGLAAALIKSRNKCNALNVVNGFKPLSFYEGNNVLDIFEQNLKSLKEEHFVTIKQIAIDALTQKDYTSALEKAINVLGLFFNTDSFLNNSDLYAQDCAALIVGYVESKKPSAENLFFRFLSNSIVNKYVFPKVKEIALNKYIGTMGTDDEKIKKVLGFYTFLLKVDAVFPTKEKQLTEENKIILPRFNEWLKEKEVSVLLLEFLEAEVLDNYKADKFIWTKAVQGLMAKDYNVALSAMWLWVALCKHYPKDGRRAAIKVYASHIKKDGGKDDDFRWAYFKRVAIDVEGEAAITTMMTIVNICTKRQSEVKSNVAVCSSMLHQSFFEGGEEVRLSEGLSLKDEDMINDYGSDNFFVNRMQKNGMNDIPSVLNDDKRLEEDSLEDLEKAIEQRKLVVVNALVDVKESRINEICETKTDDIKDIDEINGKPVYFELSRMLREIDLIRMHLLMNTERLLLAVNALPVVQEDDLKNAEINDLEKKQNPRKWLLGLIEESLRRQNSYRNSGLPYNYDETGLNNAEGRMSSEIELIKKELNKRNEQEEKQK